MAANSRRWRKIIFLFFYFLFFFSLTKDFSRPAEIYKPQWLFKIRYPFFVSESPCIGEPDLAFIGDLRGCGAGQLKFGFSLKAYRATENQPLFDGSRTKYYRAELAKKILGGACRAGVFCARKIPCNHRGKRLFLLTPTFEMCH